MLQPLEDRVLVRRPKAEEKTPGGLFIPPTAQEAPEQGFIVAVGPGRTLDDGTHMEIPLQIDDCVLLPKFGGTAVTVEDEELFILEWHEILAVLS